ncbi:hypothetical protein BaRGS_00026431 [Batillaria attramentaria]|uniref:Uncharacterized protein n=1 Tax=Batillaria attramentaria TaxID=370345 RepID=A0ABD0K615_9CAEN
MASDPRTTSARKETQAKDDLIALQFTFILRHSFQYPAMYDKGSKLGVQSVLTCRPDRKKKHVGRRPSREKVELLSPIASAKAGLQSTMHEGIPTPNCAKLQN